MASQGRRDRGIVDRGREHFREGGRGRGNDGRPEMGPTRRCYNCGQTGHLRKDCRIKQRVDAKVDHGQKAVVQVVAPPCPTIPAPPEKKGGTTGDPEFRQRVERLEKFVEAAPQRARAQVDRPRGDGQGKAIETLVNLYNRKGEGRLLFNPFEG